jgi:hypothetical protein
MAVLRAAKEIYYDTGDPGLAAKFRAGWYAVRYEIEGWREAVTLWSWRVRGIKPGLFHIDPETGEQTVVVPMTRCGLEYFDHRSSTWRPLHERIP